MTRAGVNATRALALALATGAALVLAGCRDAGRGSEVDADGAAERRAAAGGSTEVAQEYAPELGVDLDRMQRTESGLYYEDTQPGTGEEAEAGRHVVVHYTGHLPDGSVFDSSVERGDPFDLVLGTGAVIGGWEEGLLGMREGGRRRLVIPPALAYGAGGRPPVIPPESTLIFDVELLQVH
jgi:FKBP-type peptidyl-prolyl cis-trans isomerase FkpA